MKTADDGRLTEEQELQYDAELERRARATTSPEQVALELPDGMAPCSDTANAHRLLAWHGADLRYVGPLGGWFVFGGVRWELDEEAALRRAQATAMRMLLDAADAVADAARDLARAVLSKNDLALQRAKAAKEAADRAFGWACSSQNAKGLKSMLEIARAHATLAPGAFDADPFKLNVINGTIDLRSAVLSPHSRADLMTKLAPVRYEGLLVKHEILDRYLDASTAGHDGLRDFLGRMLGSVLIGENPEEAFYVVHGRPGTGKSTLLLACAGVLGDYACAADVATFLASQVPKSGGDARPDLAKLAGRRLVICAEVPKGRRFDEALVKQLTSDRISARKLYRDEFEFDVTFKIWLACNDAPRVSPEEEAIWRRLHLVPLDNMVPEAERDPKVKATLRDVGAIGSALLAFAMMGCIAYQQGGLQAPPCVKEATTAYKDAQDPLRLFLEECCVVGDPLDWATGPELRKAYEAHAKEAGNTHLVGADMFGKRLAARGCVCKPQRVGGKVVRCWYGVRLMTTSDHAIMDESLL